MVRRGSLGTVGTLERRAGLAVCQVALMLGQRDPPLGATLLRRDPQFLACPLEGALADVMDFERLLLD